MLSDDSSIYITSYSQDERIEKALKIKRQRQKERRKKIETERSQMFKIRPPFPKGFHCVTYNPLKIKLCFRPSEVVTYVNKTIRFYLSLRHIGGHWRVKRDTIPANCKWSIYKLFYTKQSFAIDDENILEKIGDIYKLLVRWSQKHQKFRLTKFERYQCGEDVILDSDDEVLFLSEAERQEKAEKRNRILQRMIPPIRRGNKSRRRR